VNLRSLCATVLALFAAIGSAQEKGGIDAITRRGIDLVYNLEFEQADREFGELVRLRPDHPSGYFFRAMVTWWRIQVDIDNEALDDGFHDALDEVIELSDRRLAANEDDVEALFFKGGAIGFQGRLSAHRTEWLAAANAGRRALPIVQEAAQLDPRNTDILLGTGIYNYYAEIVPREFPFVKPLMVFVPKGDREKGLQQLTAASEGGGYAAIEATYFLMQICQMFEKEYARALILAERLHARFPDNMLFHKYVGRAAISAGNWTRGTEAFAEIERRAQAGRRGYGPSTEREAAYYLGHSALAGRDFDAALRHFYRCDELSRALDRDGPSGFMVMANLKIGNIYDLQARREPARLQYRKVLDMKDYRGSTRLAEQYLAEPYRQ
jgi:tetratricopeptide (TPR) repeat protein